VLFRSQELSRLERILDEMLDFARPVRLDRRLSSVRGLIDSCLSIIDVRIRDKGIIVKKKYSPAIPQILMDPEKIEQAIINILINSVEALPEGGEIMVAARQEKIDGRSICVDISDNGAGIKSEDMPYIFDPFFSNKKKGTGLGLTNVKKIIEAHGGSVSVSMKKPRGTHFRLKLPAREVQ
jgi:signal transduction histidine kinase